jgi:hypothetical protein
MSGFEALLTGRVLADRYRIEEVIGRGGMGAVYRGTDERLGRAVAVKVITVTGGGDAESRDRLRARFRREASAAARLPHHPNVVPVYDYGTDPTLQLDFLVMELLRGEDLASRLARTGPPPMRDGLRVLEQAARGVAVGHRAGLVHRDVKPGNIFLAESDERDEMQVRVLDFGIAKVIADEDTFTQLTHDGRAPLSPTYASPEQLRGEDRLSPASDVFSLGAVGWQLLTGDRPFTDADRNRIAVGMEVPLPSLRARNPNVPEAVEAAIRRALAYDPAERFPDAGSFGDALRMLIPTVENVPFAGAAGASALAGASAIAAAPPRHRVTVDADDRTMLAPPPLATPDGRPVAAAPVIQPPRRRREEEEKAGGTTVLFWVLVLLVVAAAGGFIAWQALRGGGTRADRPLADLPDSVAPDSAGSQSQLTAADAFIADQEGLRSLRIRDYPSALAYFQKAAEIDSTKAEYRDRYAYTLIVLKRPQEAIPPLEDAIRLDPQLDLAYSHLADARLALGDTAAAVAALQRFLAVSIRPGPKAEVRRRLDALMGITPPPAPAPNPATDSTAAPRPSTTDSTGMPHDTIVIGAPPPAGR